MSDHYPECPFFAGDPETPDCICDRLRACEARVVKEIVSGSEYQGAKYNKGYGEALDKANEALNEMPELGGGLAPFIRRHAALQVIHALKVKP